jgi:hypothetical protein
MYAWSSGAFEQVALSLPTVSRARDLLASTISGLEFRQYIKQWNGEEYEEIYVPNESWMENPDPKVPRQFILANTVTDLWMTGRAFWAVTSRNATDGRPMSFEWLPSANIQTPNHERIRVMHMITSTESKSLYACTHIHMQTKM